MTPWVQFLPFVMPEVKDCPQPVALAAVRNTAIEFCEQTWVWQTTQPYTLAANAAETEFDDEEDGIVHKVLFMEPADTSGTEIKAATPDWLDARYAGWRTGLVTGARPTHYTQTSSSSFFVVPAPVAEYPISVQVVLKPTRTSVRGFDDLFNDYLEQIAVGARARLFAMVGVPWSNPQAAAALGSLFDGEKKKAQSRVQKGRGRARIRVEAQFL